MAWTLDSDRPIFLQIVERIQTDIVSGRLQIEENKEIVIVFQIYTKLFIGNLLKSMYRFNGYI